MSKLSISEAAKYVGVSRATMYSHIKKKGLSVEKDENGNQKIDMSELVRVYQDRLKTPEEAANDAGNGIKAIQSQSIQNNAFEVEVLKEKLDLKDQKCVLLQEQIDILKDSLEEQKKFTRLLTDQGGQKGKRSGAPKDRI